MGTLIIYYHRFLMTLLTMAVRLVGAELWWRHAVMQPACPTLDLLSVKLCQGEFYIS